MVSNIASAIWVVESIYFQISFAQVALQCPYVKTLCEDSELRGGLRTLFLSDCVGKKYTSCVKVINLDVTTEEDS